MKRFRNLGVLILFMPFAVGADDVGHGAPNEGEPDAVDPGTPIIAGTENESTWFDDLLALFDMEEEVDE